MTRRKGENGPLYPWSRKIEHSIVQIADGVNLSEVVGGKGRACKGRTQGFVRKGPDHQNFSGKTIVMSIIPGGPTRYSGPGVARLLKRGSGESKRLKTSETEMKRIDVNSKDWSPGSSWEID